MDSLVALLELARRAAMAPARLILEGIPNPQLRIEIQANGTVGTALSASVNSSFATPVAGPWPLLEEEFGLGEWSAKDSIDRLVLVAIDGTLGLPKFAFMQPRRALVGAIDPPAATETYSARAGPGCLVQRSTHPLRTAGDRRRMSHPPISLRARQVRCRGAIVRAADEIAELIGFEADRAV